MGKKKERWFENKSFPKILVLVLVFFVSIQVLAYLSTYVQKAPTTISIISRNGEVIVYVGSEPSITISGQLIGLPVWSEDMAYVAMTIEQDNDQDVWFIDIANLQEVREGSLLTDFSPFWKDGFLYWTTINELGVAELHSILPSISELVN